MAQPAQICNVVIQQNGKYLLVQESQAKVYGLWNLPGGHKDPGETLEQAAAREAKEETGYSVDIKKEVFVFEKPQDGLVLHAFSAEITTGELHIPPDEILDAKWFSYQEVMAMKDLRSPEYITQAIKAAHR